MARHSGHGRSQQLWTEGEALERAGKPRDAVKLFVQAALAEEEAGQPMRARILWEQVAAKAGPTPLVLERLATVSERAKLLDDALDFWVGAFLKHTADGRQDAAKLARERALVLKPRVQPHAPNALVAPTIEGASPELLAGLV